MNELSSCQWRECTFPTEEIACTNAYRHKVIWKQQDVYSLNMGDWERHREEVTGKEAGEQIRTKSEGSFMYGGSLIILSVLRRQ